MRKTFQSHFSVINFISFPSRGMAARKIEFWEIEDVRIPKFFSKECFESVLRYQPKSGDIFIATYPKCGTTWMQNVVLNILRRGQPLEKAGDFFLASPFLDQLGAEDSERLMIRPGAYKTHLTFEKVPWSKEAKYIYVARNPKDCCLSFYHHVREIPTYQFSDLTFDEFFELFMTGKIEFGDYFVHLLSWYNQKHRPNVFFTTYEEMKHDLKNVVLKVAEFLQKGDDLYLKENSHVLEKILHNCSFEEMKFLNKIINRLYDNTEEMLNDPDLPKGRKHILNYIEELPSKVKQKIHFIRKGESGGWRKVFTEDQNERMNEKIEMIRHCADVMPVWENIL